MRIPILLAVCLAVVAGKADEPDRIVLPNRPPVYNVKACGAKGDGITDDTAVFRRLLAAGKDDRIRVLYIPNGTYLLSDTIGWPRRRMLVGETRDGVVLKLKDKAPGFAGNRPKPFLHTAIPGRYYGRDSRANAAYDNHLRNLTVDTGKGNPGVIAVRYTTHNHGMIENVVIRSGDGYGKIGLDLTQTEFGPGLILNLVVDGYDVGIQTPRNVSNAVFYNLVLKHQNQVGLINDLPTAIMNLTSENRGPAIRHRGGQLILINASLTGGHADRVAIEASGTFYLRRIRTRGYKAALRADGRDIPGAEIDNYLPSTGVSIITKGSPRATLGLPVTDPPPTFREPPAKWVTVTPTGGDDTAAIQRALNSGAATIVLDGRPAAGKWGSFQVHDTLVIPATVRRIIGGFRTGLRGPKDLFAIGNLTRPESSEFGRGKPFWQVTGDTDVPLSLERIRAGCWPFRSHYLQISSRRPITIRYGLGGHPGGQVTTAPEAAGGRLFLIETPVDLRIRGDYRVYAWQYNPENNPFRRQSGTMQKRTYIVNDGGRVWIMGMKTESPAIHAITRNGGKTEILGGFFRDHFGGSEYGGDVPYFIADNASVSATYVQYAWRHGKARALQLTVIRNGEKQQYKAAPGTFGMQMLRADATIPIP